MRFHFFDFVTRTRTGTAFFSDNHTHLRTRTGRITLSVIGDRVSQLDTPPLLLPLLLLLCSAASTRFTNVECASR